MFNTAFRLSFASAALALAGQCLAVSLLPPVVTKPPQDRTVNSGIAVTFRVEANGYPPLSYQWRRNGVSLGALNTNTFVTVTGSNAPAGAYDVVITNLYGSVTSAPAFLAVRTQAPGINVEPVSQFACTGSSITFTSSVGGVSPLSLQWRLNGTPISGTNPGTNLSFLRLTNLTPAHAGSYTLVVTNSYGALTSATATLTMNPPQPVITMQPRSQVAYVGTTLFLNVQAVSCSPLGCQWRSNGVPLSSGSLATNNFSLFSLSALQADMTADYDVVLTNATGSVTSQLAIVVVTNRPPILTCQPQSQTVNAGTSVVFTVCVTSPYAFGVQWLRDGVPVAGPTNTSLVLPNVWTNDMGSYWCVVSNRDGMVTSAVATLTVLTSPPLITAPPISQSVTYGDNVTLSVGASGAPPPVFQWRRNGQDIPGAIYANLNLNYVTSSQAGDYTVVASNQFGAVTSAVATLTVVLVGPAITQQPQSQSVDWGALARFTVAASGAPPPAFQWQFNGQNLPGAVSASLDLASVTTNQAGAYRVIASNSAGAVTSAVATLTVLQRPPTITQPPQPQTVYVGDTAFFSVQATGNLPLSYQWQRNGQNIAGARSPTLYLYNATTNLAGDYRVWVTNAYGVATSASVSLTVLLRPLVIVSHPQSQTVDWGDSINFSVAASGSPPFVSRWQFNGLDVPGATHFNLYLFPVTTNEAGAYRVILSNPAGSATSAVATLTVLVRAPQIATQPRSQTVDAGNSIYFSVGAVGAVPFAFQWRFNGQDLPGETNYVLYRYSVSANDSGNYQVVVSNFVGMVTSAVARLTVLTYPPLITYQPMSQTVDAGGWGYFYVGYSGSPPMFYQWYHNGLPLSDGTNFNQTFTNQIVLYVEPATTNDAGNYWIVLSNAVGVVTSSVATLTVEVRPPVISGEPVSQTVDAGLGVLFFVSANGAPAPSYQWQRDGQSLPGATDSSLDLSTVSSNDAGGYRVVVSNFVGVVTSAVATLTVIYRLPEFIFQLSDQTVSAGNYVTFNGYASGGPPPTYQWLFNEQAMPHATNAPLQFLVTTTNQAGGYRVVASNLLGSITSAVARLRVLVAPPYFSVHPASQSVVAGDSVAFAASAYGSPSPGYQWQFNGLDIPGATSATLSFDSATTSHAGNYRVIARSEGGSTTSLVATLTVLPPGPLDHWQWRNPLPQGNDLYCAANGNGIWVALGREGARARSTDGGVTWQSHGEGRAHIRNVAYGSGLFVAVGWAWLETSYYSWLQTSPDGIHWTDRMPGLSSGELLQDVAFGNGRFVAVTSAGAAIISTNGINWTKVQGVSPAGLTRIAFGNGRFIAIANNSDVGFALISSDGGTWMRVLDFAGHFNDITYGNGLFVISRFGYYEPWQSWDRWILTSSDGRAWSAHPMLPGYGGDALAFGGGRFAAVSDDGTGETLTSTDGTNWTVHSYGLPNELYGLAYGGGRFVAVGDKGTILTSTNGDAWAVRSPGSPTNLRSLVRGNGLYVAVGNDGLTLTSLDGVTWTRRQAPTTSNLRSIAYGNDRFVAVGEIATNRAVVLVSNDGLNWAGTEAPLAYGLYSIAFGKGLFVAAGWDGAIVTSPDGLNWIRQTSGEYDRLNAITFNGALFVAVGRRGSVLVSADGAQWTSGITPTTSFLQGVAYGNGLWVAVGEAGTLLTSANALDWTALSGRSAALDYVDIEDVQFAGGHFIAVGANGFVASSTNGVVWTRHHTGCQTDLRSAFYADNHLTLVGNNETLLQSDFFGPPVLRVRGLTAGDGFEFFVDGEVGRTYRLQASEDMVSWEDVFTFSNTRVTTLFQEPDAEFYPQRFYRIVSP